MNFTTNQPHVDDMIIKNFKQESPGVGNLTYMMSVINFFLELLSESLWRIHPNITIVLYPMKYIKLKTVVSFLAIIN